MDQITDVHTMTSKQDDGRNDKKIKAASRFDLNGQNGNNNKNNKLHKPDTQMLPLSRSKNKEIARAKKKKIVFVSFVRGLGIEDMTEEILEQFGKEYGTLIKMAMAHEKVLQLYNIY